MRKKNYKQALTLEEQLKFSNKIDEKYGVVSITQPGIYQGFLYNMRESYFIRQDKQSGQSEQVSALECYFVKLNLEAFKVKIKYEPYALIQCPVQNIDALVIFLEQQNIRTEKTIREDSSAPNHVAGARTLFLKVTFPNKIKLQQFLSHITENGKYQLKTKIPQILGRGDSIVDFSQFRKAINKVAEWDVSDLVRTAIDKNIRCAEWYDVTVGQGHIKLELNTKYNDRLPPKLKVLTYDIETTKQPFCFPNAEQGDKVMCISYMIDTQGVLLVNRQIFSQDIQDFEYSPKEDMQAKFKIFNFNTEREVIEFFLQQIVATKPQVISSFNGDNFDFPFIHERCNQLGIDWDSYGFINQRTQGRFGMVSNEYLHNVIVHLDCFKWVQRDSYLPQGNQNLKAVTREKLKYEPMELDPEKMTPFAKQQPQVLAQYSVSDAVATYYLYKKFIESFILALCTIIPLPPDQILRKGTGTLCESLLMVQASNVGLVYPDKISPPGLKMEYIDEKNPVHLEIAERLKEKPSGYNLNIDKILLHKQINPDVLVENIDFSHDIEEDNMIGQLRPGGMKNIIKPEQISKTAQQRILISQTYSGGRVEALNAGIYRKDFMYKFGGSQESVDGYQQLIDSLEEDLYFGIYQKFQDEIDKMNLQSKNLSFHQKQDNDFFPRQATAIFITKNIQNFYEVYTTIKYQLIDLRDKASAGFETNPMIYHLDVSAMYPNIILTNKLQPHAVVTPKDCNSCDYNRPENRCKRQMTWIWRGMYFPCTYEEYQMIVQNLKTQERWLQGGQTEREEALKKDLETFSLKNYKIKQKSIEQYHQATICQRENPFYYDTVIQFRDRRIAYKKGQKAAIIELEAAQHKLKQLDSKADASLTQKLLTEIEKWKGKAIYNESLQLAHKAILNSFYGYAMRAGSRWYSIEMAACTTFVGAQIIKMTRSIVEKVGIPLELDTDGIWCMLPDGFPTKVEFKMMNEKKVAIEQYATNIFNARTAKHFNNDQFQKREEPIDLNNNSPNGSIMVSEVELQKQDEMNKTIQQYDINEYLTDNTENKMLSNIFEVSTMCTIQFELDGPYAAMFLSAAKEEGKKVKKRYCVFDENKKISELKGFELKRRGELKLIKAFQERLFPRFLDGNNTEATYHAVGMIASRFLDILRRKGEGYEEELLLDLLSESSTIKNSIENTDASKKSTAITTAKRLGESIDQYFTKVAGLNCQFIISKYPLNTAVSERAIPVQIFTSPVSKRNQYLTEWTKQQQIEFNNEQKQNRNQNIQPIDAQDKFNLSQLLDWDYYEQRFINSLMRLIIIPAGIQGLTKSPVNGVPFPQWLQKGNKKELNIIDMLNILQKEEEDGDNEKSQVKQQLKVKNQRQEESDDKESSSESNDEDEKKETENEIDNILLQNNIQVPQNVLKNLYALQFNKITRDQSASLWLEKQKKKWNELIANRYLNKSLEQIHKDYLYSFNSANRSRKIVSNNILSQLQGMIVQHNYVVLNIKQRQLGIVDVVIFSPKQKEIIQTQISVKKEIIINQNNVDLSNFEDPNIVITPASHKNVQYMENQQNLFSYLPNDKIRNLFKLEIDEKFYKDNIQFFNQQLTTPNILGVYHKQMSLVERLIIYLGCFININPKVAQSLSTGRLDFKDLSSTKLTDANYLFNYSSSKFIMPVAFCVYVRLNEGEILALLTQEKFLLKTTVDLQDSELDAIFNDFKEKLGSLLETLKNTEEARDGMKNDAKANESVKVTTNREKELLRRILQTFYNVTLYTERFPPKPSSLFEDLKTMEWLSHSIVFYHGTSVFDTEKRGFKRNFLSFGKNGAIFADSGLNIADGEVKLTQTLLEAVGVFAQLEGYARVSQVPMFNLLFNGGIYGTNQSYRLPSVDFLYMRELINRQHVLWLTHDGRQDGGSSTVQLELPLEVKQKSNPDFYYTVAAVFEMEYVFAQVIISELRKDKAQSSKILSNAVQKLKTESPSLLKYLEEYASNHQSLLFSQKFTNRIVDAVNKFLDNIYNISFSQQLIPVHLSCHKLIITSDKIDERLATYKIKSFLEVFNQEFGIIYLDIIQTWRQFFFQDQNNYVGHTLQHTIDAKSIYGSTMSGDYYDSAKIILATFLLNINEFVNDVQPPVSSILQLPEIAQASIQYYKQIKNQLLNINNNLDYNTEPNCYLLQMKNISELRTQAFTSPAKQLLSPMQDSGWLYLNYIFDTLALNKHITQRCYNFLQEMKRLFTHASDIPLQPLGSFELRIYCQLCQDYIALDLTAELSNDSIHCPRCQSSLRKHEIEGLFYQKVQRIFLQQTADRIPVLQKLHAIAELYKMFTVQMQIQILISLL